MAHAVHGVGPSGSAKHDVIQVRVAVEATAIRSRAATLRRQMLSQFVLDCALHQAMETILDQRALLSRSAGSWEMSSDVGFAC